jgi:antitoxin MazE
MKTRVHKWGNSLALRIPSAFAKEISIDEDSEIDISLQNGVIVVTPLLTEPFKLENLLAGITADNLHTEIDTGDTVGNEAW